MRSPVLILKSLVERLDPQLIIVSVFSATMILSLVCSLSVQQGHAGGTVADSAQQIEPLQNGRKAPAFVVRSADDEGFSFNPESLARPVVIVTFRGGWCPYCNMHLSELRTVVPEISAMGIDVLFLSGDRPELLYASLAANTQEAIADLDYRIYSDADAKAAIALGIAFKASDQAHRATMKILYQQDADFLLRVLSPFPSQKLKLNMWFEELETCAEGMNYDDAVLKKSLIMLPSG